MCGGQKGVELRCGVLSVADRKASAIGERLQIGLLLHPFFLIAAFLLLFI